MCVEESVIRFILYSSQEAQFSMYVHKSIRKLYLFIYLFIMPLYVAIMCVYPANIYVIWLNGPNKTWGQTCTSPDGLKRRDLAVQ